jgi:hypothetical protein
MEVPGERLSQQVEGGEAVLSRDRFVVMEGAYNNGAGREGERFLAEAAGGFVEPGIEVGLSAAFEFQQAAGDGVDAGGDGKVMKEKVMPVAGMLKKDG